MSAPHAARPCEQHWALGPGGAAFRGPARRRVAPRAPRPPLCPQPGRRVWGADVPALLQSWGVDDCGASRACGTHVSSEVACRRTCQRWGLVLAAHCAPRVGQCGSGQGALEEHVSGPQCGCRARGWGLNAWGACRRLQGLPGPGRGPVYAGLRRRVTWVPPVGASSPCLPPQCPPQPLCPLGVVFEEPPRPGFPGTAETGEPEP